MLPFVIMHHWQWPSVTMPHGQPAPAGWADQPSDLSSFPPGLHFESDWRGSFSRPNLSWWPGDWSTLDPWMLGAWIPVLVGKGYRLNAWMIHDPTGSLLQQHSFVVWKWWVSSIPGTASSASARETNHPESPLKRKQLYTTGRSGQILYETIRFIPTQHAFVHTRRDVACA